MLSMVLPQNVSGQLVEGEVCYEKSAQPEIKISNNVIGYHLWMWFERQL